jgi:hypothetical protein
VKVGAPSVEITIPDAVQDPQADEVHHEPGGRDDQEESCPDRLGVLDPLDRLDHHPAGNSEQRCTVDQSGQNLPPLVAIGLAVAGGPERYPSAEESEPQRPRIGEHVAGIGDQGERAAEPSPDGLDHHEGEGKGEDDRQAGQRGSGAVRRQRSTVGPHRAWRGQFSRNP